MKKLIYLSLVAIVILSSCKGNSFITQRYTKFGHTFHKTCYTEKTLAKTSSPVIAENNSETEIAKNGEAEPVSATSNSFLTKENILERIPVQIFPNGLKLTKTEGLEADDSKHVYKSKKTFEQKKQTAKKVIGTVLKNVLWIVILAVVVGVFLIIAAVA